MSEPLLKIKNHHVPACGDPPIVDSESGDTYIGYFENPHGEQWIFAMDRKSGEAVLRGGDIGWNDAQRVIDGTVPDLILGHAEQLWLKACWLAAAELHA
jgi:hypothetical protein